MMKKWNYNETVLHVIQCSVLQIQLFISVCYNSTHCSVAQKMFHVKHCIKVCNNFYWKLLTKNQILSIIIYVIH